MTADYKETLNLPETAFPMRANLAKREPGFLDFWKKEDIFGKMKKNREGKPSFVLHDGPPYANGHIHIGTAFNKILKDFIPKYKAMRGFFAPYVPGWDTHGLPIELHVLKSLGATKDTIDPVLLREKCTEYALEFLDVQRKEFIRLGVLGDWENPYITLNPEYEAAQLGAFADLVAKGLVYKGQKPVFWCIDCQTALAAAEIEYWDEKSPSVFVAYSLPEAGEINPVLAGKDVNIIVWTTTPWTLPASMAVALGGSHEYGFYRSGEKVYLFAKALLESVSSATGLSFDEELLVVMGKDLEGFKARHPFYPEREIPLLLADYVLLDTGTGCVHTAPGHGVEDYESGVKYGIPVYNPVDGKGYFKEGTGLVDGLSLKDGSKKVMEVLADSGRLLGSHSISHSYPHCWRCKKPVIFRSTDQWFIAVSEFRSQALMAIEKDVRWIPEWGKERIYNMVRDRSDWCISRQRIWGVPIPAFYCEGCGKPVLTEDRIRAILPIVRKKGCSAWWSMTPKELLGDLAVCPHCGGGELRKETDIMDVWFDSGTSHEAVLKTRPELKWPADMYLEGSDQHRGWFQTSLLTSVGMHGKPPFEQVLTHGFIVDGEGKKMSKSIGNTVSPQEVIDQYGADILRFWVASTDYRNDIRISPAIVKNLSESYRRIRNTARYLLANLKDFDPAVQSVPFGQMTEMDRWILLKLKKVIGKGTAAFDDYEFHIPTVAIHQFCVNELSSFYLDSSKDRMYADGTCSLSRKSGQTAMWRILSILTGMLAPVLSFTAEEIWQEMRKIDGKLEESVFLSDWPSLDDLSDDEELEKKWDAMLTVRSAVSRALEIARGTSIIGHPLDARVEVEVEGAKDVQSLFSEEELRVYSIVSDFRWVDRIEDMPVVHEDDETGVRVGIARAEGEKCPRCWQYRANRDARGLCPRCASVLSEEEGK
ncbi:MAG: isoleucine--tRNA ligase [Synergistaceae bacterium]|nr:isoleucine--tRNA ligase [Synergistaceae bacterium]